MVVNPARIRSRHFPAIHPIRRGGRGTFALTLLAFDTGIRVPPYHSFRMSDSGSTQDTLYPVMRGR